MTDKIETRADVEHVLQLLSAKADNALEELKAFAKEKGVKPRIAVNLAFNDPLDDGKTHSISVSNSSDYIALMLAGAIAGAKREEQLLTARVHGNDVSKEELSSAVKCMGALGNFINNNSESFEDFLTSAHAAYKTSRVMGDIFNSGGVEH